MHTDTSILPEDDGSINSNLSWCSGSRGLRQQPRDEIDVHLDDGELADVQDLVD